MNLRTVSSLIAAVAALAAVTFARPELVISDDQRNLIYIGSFGFLAGGTLDMKLDGLKVTKDKYHKSDTIRRSLFLMDKP